MKWSSILGKLSSNKSGSCNTYAMSDTQQSRSTVSHNFVAQQSYLGFFRLVNFPSTNNHHTNMATSDTDDDINVSIALLIASTVWKYSETYQQLTHKQIICQSQLGDRVRNACCLTLLRVWHGPYWHLLLVVAHKYFYLLACLFN